MNFLFLVTSLAALQSFSVLAASEDQNFAGTKLPSEGPRSEHDEDMNGDSKVFDRSLVGNVHLHQKDDANDWRYAAGVNFAWSIRRDYGARTFRRFEPEAVGYIYTELPWSSLWLRHGARLGFSNNQPQMPKSVRLEETDWKIAVEEGLIWNWYVAPSLAFGAGYDWRTIKLKTSEPVTSADSRLNSKESFLWSYAQAGIGLPALSGRFEFQPTVRWQNLVNDTRTNWAFGFEVTVAW